jgi:signal transduction histidine kinase/CheY-like chemotaxis protein
MVHKALQKLKQNIRAWSAILAAVVVAALCIGLRTPDTPPILRVGIRQYPPYLLENADGTSDGLAVDILTEAARRRGIRLQWSIQTEGPDRALEGGKVDLWPLLNLTSARERRIHVSSPWMVSEFILLARKSSGIMTTEQTVGKRVAFLDRPVVESMVGQYMKNILPVPRVSHEAALRTVCTGEAEAAFLDLRFAQSILMDHPADCEGSSLQYTLVSPALLPLGVASTRKYARTADLLASEILKMGADGTLAGILSQWSVIGTHDTEALNVLAKLEAKSRYLAYVIAVMALLVVLLAILARRLHSAREIASRAVQVKATLLTNVSHEIRTPMNGVMGMTDLLFTTDLTDEQRDYAEAVHSSAESLLEMLNNMLDYARMDQGKLDLENVDFDLHGLLEDVAEHFGPYTARKRLELACVIAPDTPQIVTGDPVKLRKVLNNLMSNGLKFTNSGEIVLSSRVVSEDADGIVLQIEVTDTGVGIPEEDRPKLFRTFGQLDTPGSRSHSGAGLGLAICKQIVAGGGGYIDYHSKPGSGSSFWIVMRFGRVNYNLPPIQADPDVAGRRVLIASGSTAVRMMIRNHCRALAMKTSEAAGVAHALDLLRKTEFDLIVGDDNLVDMAKLAAAKPLSAKLILLTSTSSQAHGQPGAPTWDDAGVDTILSKPVRQHQLSHAVREVLMRAGPEDCFALAAYSQPADSVDKATRP